MGISITISVGRNRPQLDPELGDKDSGSSTAAPRFPTDYPAGLFPDGPPGRAKLKCDVRGCATCTLYGVVRKENAKEIGLISAVLSSAP
ncbi:hypothetical protein CCMA1212_003905 [Trichoderma ghanense]|uniref:Uncharacterized protein n=1 Tax=Trichoderma ghanense TaxID=65468 RepID=A0ABY2HAW8_9HYPO